MLVVQGSHFVHHWARAQEASENEGVGSERKQGKKALITNVKTALKPWSPIGGC